MILKEYDDGFTRKSVDRITVAVTGTIRVKLRNTDMEIEQKLY